MKPDADTKYYTEVVIDLDEIAEPMIADPDVNNEDVSKRYTRTFAHYHSMEELKSRFRFRRILYSS